MLYFCPYCGTKSGSASEQPFNAKESVDSIKSASKESVKTAIQKLSVWKERLNQYYARIFAFLPEKTAFDIMPDCMLVLELISLVFYIHLSLKNGFSDTMFYVLPIIFWVLKIIFAHADSYYLAREGYKTPNFLWAVIFLPFYVTKREKATNVKRHLLIVLSFLIIVIAVCFSVYATSQKNKIETIAQKLVNQKNSSVGMAVCDSVKINRRAVNSTGSKLSFDGKYIGTAYLNDGNTLKIEIEADYEKVSVRISPDEWGNILNELF
ncbi:MAG: hypothetical protein LBS16_02995 [Prevotellaceae bacterium]|jgi:hypothetical protein|nr:hypothetical protein [Prevotellaceae bacterium]